MKRMLLLLLSFTLLSGCAPAESAAPTATAAPAATPTAMPAATETPAPEPTVTPEPEPGLDYDEIRMVLCEGYNAAELREGYYTMSKDGLWGLMRADGTQVLPCEALSPVLICGALRQWHWDVYKNWDELDALSQELQAAGDGALCAGHGGMSFSFFYDLDSPGRDTSAVDLSALRCLVGGTPGQSVAMEDAYWEYFGDLLPVYSAHEDPEGAELCWPGPMVENQRGDGQTVRWWYIGRDGSALQPANLDKAGWFFAEALAPVERDGKWGYLDRSGELATEVIYDPVCASASWGGQQEPMFGAPLCNGYAVVRRGDGWGLLDASGTEVIPCEKQGVAWEGTVLWIKDDTGWHRTELPV